MTIKDIEIMQNRTNFTPWVSFCIATYRRPNILKDTLHYISQQSFSDFEVIVSDNDPTQSSRCVVEEFNDKRFLYFSNSENVGMVKNFNIALKNAHGDFVVMIADDDPPRIDFLQTMHALWQDWPNYGAYFGACEVIIASEDAAAAYQVNMGPIKFLADAPEDTIRCFSREQFPGEFFELKVFPYTLWSTGIVRRDIATCIGGMPDYGSALLTDLSYVAVVGSYAGCVTINKVMGGQIVHGANSGLVSPHDVELALKGCHKYLNEHLSGRDDWLSLEGRVEKFLATYIVKHCIAMRVHFSRNGNKVELEKLHRTLKRMFVLQGMEKMYFYYIRAQLIDKAKFILRPITPILKYMYALFKSNGACS